MRFKSPAVDAIRIVENAMEMRMVLVYVAGHEILIFTFQKLLTYLLTELQGSFGSDLTGLDDDDIKFYDEQNSDDGDDRDVESA